MVSESNNQRAKLWGAGNPDNTQYFVFSARNKTMNVENRIRKFSCGDYLSI